MRIFSTHSSFLYQRRACPGVSYLLQLEIRLFLNYTDTDLEHMRIGAGKIFPMENNLSLELGADYRFTNEFSGFVSYDLFNELDNNLLKLGARLHF